MTPAAKQKSVKTTAAVVRVGVVGDPSGVRGRARVRQPDDDEQGEPGRRVRREQREGRDEEDRRRLARFRRSTPCSVVAVAVPSKSHPRPADLVLSGGGVKGIGLVGAVVALMDAGYRTQRVSGTSAGSIVGAIVAAAAQGDKLSPEEVKDACTATGLPQIHRRRSARARPGGGSVGGCIAWNRRVQGRLRARLGSQPVGRISVSARSAIWRSAMRTCPPNSVTGWSSRSPM